jgi:hypothetical protein
MPETLDERWQDQMTDRLYLLSPSQPNHPRQSGEVPSRHNPSGAETALEAAFIVRQVQITGAQRTAG